MIRKNTRQKWNTPLIVLAVLTLSACGDKSATPTSDNATRTEAVQEADITVQEESADAEKKKLPETEEIEQPEAKEAYVFRYNDLVIAVDMEMAPVLETLGEPGNYFEAASCAFEGLDKIYTYNDFEISTYPVASADVISLIVLRSDIVATPEGISIGNDVSKVTEKYGEGEEEQGVLVYEKGGMKLCFIIREEKVISIEYRSAALN